MTKKNLSRREFIKKTANASLAGAVFSPGTSVINSSLLQDKSKTSNSECKFGYLCPNEFYNPGTDYRGVPLWLWNDRLDKDEVIRQLKGIKYAGWGLVLPRRFDGLLHVPYQKEWNDIMQEVLKTCESLKMKVFLQEGNVPFPAMKKEYGHKMLVRRPVNETPPESETLILKKGEYAYYLHLAYDPVRTTAFRKIDTLDENSMNAYFTSLFGFYSKTFGDALGKTIDSVWVDEPVTRRAQGLPPDSVPWTTKLTSIFEKQWGYSLTDNIPSLFEETGDFRKVRYHYWRTICELFTETYWKLMHDFCDKHGVYFSGHQYGEDSFARQLHHAINCTPHYEYMQRPGIDHLTGSLHWPSDEPFIMPPKQASSVAHQLNKEQVLCEMYGVSDQGTSFEDRKWIYQWLAVLGMNFRCYHGTFYSMRGHRKRVWPLNLNYQQPWWNDNRIAGDFGARISYALRQGKYKADILMIHSMESYYLDPKLENREPVKTGKLNQDFIETSHNLLKIQRSYDYGDESLLAKYGKIKNNKISLGEIEYKIVIIPSVETLRKTTIDILTKFMNNGGTVAAVGTLPKLIDGESSGNISKFNSKLKTITNNPKALKTFLDKVTPSETKLVHLNNISTETIWLMEKQLDTGRMFFLANVGRNKPISTEFQIKGKGKLEYWNLENGKVESIPQEIKEGYISTKLEFHPAGSHLLVLNETVPSVNAPEKRKQIAWNIPVQNYTIERQDPNAFTLDFCRYSKGKGEWSEILPIIGIQEKLSDEKYSGPVSLEFSFTSEFNPANCAVVIENAEEYDIQVNGNSTNYKGLPYYRDKSFHPVDISHLVNEGTNKIRISRHFEPPDPKYIDEERTYGTELEQIYIIGDIAVKGKRIGRDVFETPRHRYTPKFTVTNEKSISDGDLLQDGYCFFNGTLSLITTAVLPKAYKGEKVFLEIDQINSTLAKIKVNNYSAGHLAWHPFRLDITDYVWEGENKIEISLTNSLRNLLGSVHYVPVPVSNPWPSKASPRAYDGKNWLEMRKNGTIKSWTDDYFFRPFGLEGKAGIVCVKTE